MSGLGNRFRSTSSGDINTNNGSDSPHRSATNISTPHNNGSPFSDNGLSSVFGANGLDGMGGLGNLGAGVGGSHGVHGGVGAGLGGLGGLSGLSGLSPADTSALLELSRLSPEEMAAVLAAAGVTPPAQGGTNIETLLGLNTAFNESHAAGNANGRSETSTSPATGSTHNTPSTENNRPSPATAGASARPDLVRLADLVTHASLVLQQPQAAGPRKYTRSRRGCLTCRARKVKCDEVRPKCLRCAAMGRECTWDEEKPDKGKKPKPPKKSASTGTSSIASASTGIAGTAAASGTLPTPPPIASKTTTPGPSRSRTAPTVPQPIRSGPTPSAPPPRPLEPSSTSLPNLPILNNLNATGQYPGNAPTPPTSAHTLAAAGLPTALAKALAEMAQNVGSPAGSHLGHSTNPADWTNSPLRRQSDPTPSFLPSHFPPSAPHMPFKPTPPSSGFAEPNAKRQRPNDATPSQLAGLPFDFQSWVHNVNLGSPPSAKGSEGSEVIELTRTAPDERGRIQLEPADGPTPMVVDEDDIAQTGDIRLSLKGKLARRRHGDPQDTSFSSLSPTSSDASGSTERPAEPSTVSDSSRGERVQMPSVSSLIRLATQPSRELDPFMHAFPTASTRDLFEHYVSNTSQIVTAMGRTKPRENPFLQVSLPLILGEGGNSTPGCAALRFSLLTTSAAHLLHLRGGQDAADLCDRLKKLAIGYTVISQAEAEKDRRANNGELISPRAEQDNDLVLAACVVLVTRDVLSADKTWKANLEFALASIRRRGGPEALIARDPSSFMRRFVLEQLATHEVFSCFTTGSEPTLLQPHAQWWFDIEKSSQSYWEWESVENQFGVSRKMIEVVARICGLCARKNRLGLTASLDDPELSVVADHLRDEAKALIAELDMFAVSLRSLPLQRRVQYGDHIYRMAMTLHLTTEILGVPPKDERIRSLVPAILELCSEISNEPVMLVWPLLFVARVAEPEERKWVRSLIASYADQYCRDLQVADQIIQELWKRQDEGKDMGTWHGLLSELGQEILLI